MCAYFRASAEIREPGLPRNLWHWQRRREGGPQAVAGVQSGLGTVTRPFSRPLAGLPGSSLLSAPPTRTSQADVSKLQLCPPSPVLQSPGSGLHSARSLCFPWRHRPRPPPSGALMGPPLSGRGGPPPPASPRPRLTGFSEGERLPPPPSRGKWDLT